MVAAFFGFSLIAAFSVQSAPPSGRALLEQMRAAYLGKWFRTLTFVQKTTIVRADGTRTEQTWFESMKSPAVLRIDVAPLADGNGSLNFPDKVIVMRGGQISQTRPGGNPFLPFVAGIYTQPLEDSITQLAPQGYDLTKTHVIDVQGRRTIVVGTATRDELTVPQFWVDAERLVVTRVLLRSGAAGSPLLDIALEGYVKSGQSWVATKVSMSSGGSLRQLEEYSDLKTDVDLPDALFEPATWQTARHWAQAQTAGKQAVIETSMGQIVIALLPAKAPNHVGYFMKLAGDGSFAGTTFHRVVKYGIIQGGDPLSKDPAKSAQYGTGGLNVLRREMNDEPMTAGAVAAVLVPNQPNSAGAQFFINASDQVALQGQFTVFGRVVEGIEVVQQISAVQADAQGRPAERIVIKSVTIRDTPPPVKDPLVEATAADLAKYRAILETSKGEIEIEFLTDKAPETSRQFLRLSSAGVYDGTPFHRVVANFVLQTGALAFREKPLTAVQNALVHNLQPEFSDVANVPGIVSMARGEDPASASTSFFICTGECRALDGKYTVFARVVRGMDVVKAIAAVPVDGETPKDKITLTRVRVIK